LTTLGVKMGVWITGVDKGSVAEGAGIKVGDVVVAVQGQSQLTSMVLEKALSSVRGVITLRVVRDRQPLLIRVNSQQ
jgi:S1-C subfamily serine protease